MRLILKLLVGLCCGIIVGFYGSDQLIRLMLTFKHFGAELINYTIPFIIFFYIASGIASLATNSRTLLLKTVLFSYTFTIIASVIAFIIAKFTFTGLSGFTQDIVHQPLTLTGFLDIEIPPVFSVMTALISAFVFGMGITITKSSALKQVIDEAANIVELFLMRVIIPLLPFYIAGVFATMAAEGTVFSAIKSFGFVLGLALCVHWLWLSLQYVIVGVLSGQSPFKLLRTMLPAYFTALSTMSSAATIPVTLNQTKKLGVNPNIAQFTIPLCATIHIAGSAITLVICATAVIISQGQTMPTMSSMFPFIIMLGLIMVAAPGVPGGGVMAASGLLVSMLGFSQAELALMIVLYIAQDSFGTACNVTGDGAISILVDQSSKEAVLNQPDTELESETVIE